MSNFFDTRVENLESKGDKRKSSVAAKKIEKKETYKKQKKADSD